MKVLINQNLIKKADAEEQRRELVDWGLCLEWHLLGSKRERGSSADFAGAGHS